MAIEILKLFCFVQGIIHKAVTSGKAQQEGFGFFQTLPDGQPPKIFTNISYFNFFVSFGLKTFKKPGFKSFPMIFFKSICYSLC